MTNNRTSELQRTKKKYTKISEKRRNRLIYMTLTQSIPIPKASKLLKIKLSTAKNIIKIYKTEGKILEKKMALLTKKQSTKNHLNTQPNEQIQEQKNILLPRNVVKMQQNEENMEQIISVPANPEYIWVPYYFLPNYCFNNQNQNFI